MALGSKPSWLEAVPPMTDRSKLLMVAYEFPPCLSAGVQRTLKFAQHLPSHGWDPVVLTTSASAYARRDEALPIPPEVDVRRAWSFDSSRRLAVSGRYLTITSTPDRYSSWYPFADPKGTRRHPRARHRRPSTPPIRSSPRTWSPAPSRVGPGCPWIADFRDPAPEHYEPGHEAFRLASQRGPRRRRGGGACSSSRPSGCKSSTSTAIQDCDPGKAVVIENGYDEDRLDALSQAGRTAGGSTFDILHSGAIYPRGRDITCLLEALAHGPSHTPDGRLIRLRLRGGRKSEDPREAPR